MLDEVEMHQRGAESTAVDTSVTLAMVDLVVDETLQMRGETDKQTAKRYTDALRAHLGEREAPLRHGEAPSLFPPITVARVGGVLMVADGFHRVVAHLRCDVRAIKACVVDCEDLDQARWIATKGNLRNSLPYSSSRKVHRGLFQAYVKARQHRTGKGRSAGFKSYRDIARELGSLVPHTTLRNWMREDFNSVFRAMAGDTEPERVEDWQPADPEQEHLVSAQGHIEAIEALARGIKTPEARGS